MSGDVADNRHEPQPAAGSIGTSLTVFYLQARNWAIGSDPGLLRLRMASRTTAALGSALLILFLLTKATGQPLTVALLGVLITMTSARQVNEPDPRRHKISMALLPVPAALAITAAAAVAPHPVVADAGFVLVVFTAVYARRFGPRGTALGMVTFMSYFFTLYLRAKISELPWLIGAVSGRHSCAASCGASTCCLIDREAYCEKAFGRCGRGWRSSWIPPPKPCGPASSMIGAGAGCGSGPAGSTRPR